MLSFPNAKINLGLHVTRKRNDGYHELETVFYPVAIKDALELNDATATSFHSEGISIPGGEQENICLKAYHLLVKDYPLTPQKITLLKRIPVGAGLGGGSSDAAFVLKMLNQKFDLALSAERLMEYARQLGADCAFFLKNTPVYAFARGDEFEPVTIDLSCYFLVLVKPPVHVSTQDAYQGIVPRAPLHELRTIMASPVASWRDKLVNDFETNIFVKYPSISAVKDELYAQGAIFAQMSGSGASVFGIFESPVKLNFPADHLVFYSI